MRRTPVHASTTVDQLAPVGELTTIT